MKKQIDRWLLPVALGGVVIATLLWALLTFVRIPSLRNVRSQVLRPTIILVSSHADDRERRELSDLDPLFLPTSHNTSILELPAWIRREPGSMSFTFQPKLSELEAKGGVTIVEDVFVPSRAIEVLSIGEHPPSFREFGRRDVDIHVLATRLAFIEVIDSQTGRLILSTEVSPTPERKSPVVDWLPVEYLMAVDRAGIVGSPAVTISAASEEVESFFSEFLAKEFSFGARLTPGFYTVHVGP